MRKTTFIFTGDSFITRKLPERGYAGFDEIAEIIKQYDVRFNNLEITVHDNEGYPDAESGGTWAMTDPQTLESLLQFGFNVFNTANNHAMDYGHGGLLATIRQLRERKVAFSGTGATLAEASAPAYVETSGARAAIIGACSTCFPSSVAGNARIDMKGRPGLNPIRFETVYKVRREYFDVLSRIAAVTNMNAEREKSVRDGYTPPFPEGKFNFGGLTFMLSETDELCTAPLEKDVLRIAASVEEAKRQADYAMVSIHAHESLDGNSAVPANFIKEFARLCIDKGADAVIGHGPHELRGIEIYNGKPIFYSLGNFVFQTETIALQPADAYEKHSMSNLTTVGQYMSNRSKNETRGYVVQPNIWRSVMAGMTAVDGSITRICLYPVTLHMEAPRSRRGWPSVLKGEEMKKDGVLEYLASLSKPFGTELRIENNCAFIDLV